MTRQELHDLLIRFVVSEPMADVWRRYPDVTEAEDEATDGCACVSMSERFAALSGGTVIVGEDPDTGWSDRHAWTRVAGWNVDWTARQFHNLEHPPSPAHADLPCPLVWRGEQHPVVAFRTVRVGGPDAPRRMMGQS